MLILTANPQPKPHTGLRSCSRGFWVFVNSASATRRRVCSSKKEREGEEASKGDEQEGDKKGNARQPGSPLMLISPGLFLRGYNKKPFLSKIRMEKTCDGMAEEDGEA